MNRIITLFSLLFTLGFMSTVNLSAQYVLTGMVRDSATHVGLSNKTVVITQKNSVYSKTVTTNNSGIFYDTLNLPYGMHKWFYATTADCNNNLVTDSILSHQPGIIMLTVCSGPGQALCQAGFSFWQSGNNFKKVHFLNTSSISTDTYIWSFGDGDTSYQKSPVHIYSFAGAYEVCLIATDTDISCTSSVCDTVFAFPGNSCSNDFSYTSSNLTVYLQASVNTSYPTSYQWDFGDGTSADTNQNCLHTYTHGGTYQVCLTTTSISPWSYDTCITTKCKQVHVTGGPLVNISGQIFRGTSYLDTGRVYLYEYQSNNGKYRLYDSSEVIYVDSLGISYYYFDMIPVGKYITKVVPLPSSVFYNTFAPAYYGNTIHWDATAPFDLHSQGYDYPMNVTEIKQWNGLSSIEGKVMEGTAKLPGDPVANVPVFLVDADNFVLGYTYSNANGYFNFSDLPYNKYYLYADMINYDVYPSTTTTSEADRNSTGINIYIGKDKITGIDQTTTKEQKILLSPNPVAGLTRLSMDLESDEVITIELYDALGKRIMTIAQNEYAGPGQHHWSIDASDLSNGIYHLKISGKHTRIKPTKLIVVH